MFQNHRIFDIHTHAFPDAIAEKAIRLTAQKSNFRPHHDGTIGSLSDYEARGGSDGFLFLPIATNPKSVRGVNDWAAAQVGGQVHAFGSVHPDMEDLEAELDYICSLGLRGIKLHPEYQTFYADDARMFPIYKAAFDRGLIICFHAGVDAGYPPPPVRGDCARIARVCDAFPDGRIIAAHMGGYQQPDIVCRELAGRENLWIDTSLSFRFLAPEQIMELSRLHGTRRVLFGTDAPWSQFEQSRDVILNAGFTGEELRDILYDNAARLLEID